MVNNEPILFLKGRAEISYSTSPDKILSRLQSLEKENESLRCKQAELNRVVSFFAEKFEKLDSKFSSEIEKTGERFRLHEEKVAKITTQETGSSSDDLVKLSSLVKNMAVKVSINSDRITSLETSVDSKLVEIDNKVSSANDSQTGLSKSLGDFKQEIDNQLKSVSVKLLLSETKNATCSCTSELGLLKTSLDAVFLRNNDLEKKFNQTTNLQSENFFNFKKEFDNKIINFASSFEKSKDQFKSNLDEKINTKLARLDEEVLSKKLKEYAKYSELKDLKESTAKKLSEQSDTTSKQMKELVKYDELKDFKDLFFKKLADNDLSKKLEEEISKRRDCLAKLEKQVKNCANYDELKRVKTNLDKYEETMNIKLEKFVTRENLEKQEEVFALKDDFEDLAKRINETEVKILKVATYAKNNFSKFVPETTKTASKEKREIQIINAKKSSNVDPSCKNQQSESTVKDSSESNKKSTPKRKVTIPSTDTSTKTTSDNSSKKWVHNKYNDFPQKPNNDSIDGEKKEEIIAKNTTGQSLKRKSLASDASPSKKKRTNDTSNNSSPKGKLPKVNCQGKESEKETSKLPSGTVP